MPWYPSWIEPLPVGFVYISLASTNPAALLGYGTWTPRGGTAHNNIQPSWVVYMWERTA